MRPNYLTNDPKGWCGNPRAGAAHGRHTIIEVDKEHWYGRLYMSVVPLNSGGYDRLGTYFGLGDRIYWVAGARGDIDFCVRAKNRTDAKKQVRELLPHARFFK